MPSLAHYELCKTHIISSIYLIPNLRKILKESSTASYNENLMILVTSFSSVSQYESLQCEAGFNLSKIPQNGQAFTHPTTTSLMMSLDPLCDHYIYMKIPQDMTAFREQLISLVIFQISFCTTSSPTDLQKPQMCQNPSVTYPATF